MTCAEFERHVSPYIDGELTAAESLAVDAHRRDCSACRRLAAAMLRTRDVMQASAPPPPAIPFVPQPATARRHRYLLPLAAAAALLLLALVPQFGTAPAAPPTAQGTATTAAPDMLALDCRVGARGSSCEIEVPASFCSSARDCGISF